MDAGFLGCKIVALGPSVKASVQAYVIPRKDWQPAESSSDYTLVGCSVDPGFDFADFTLMRDEGRSSKRLVKVLPDIANRI